MKEITAYTIHEAEGCTIASVIYREKSEGKITGTNKRKEVSIKDEKIKQAEKIVKKYLEEKLGG